MAADYTPDGGGRGSTLPRACDKARDKLERWLKEECAPGSRIPPIKELAKVLGTGQTSTHHAAKTLAAEGILVSRPGAGTFVVDTEGFGGQRVLEGSSVVIRRSSVDSFFDPATETVKAMLSKAGALVRTDDFAVQSPSGDVVVSDADAEILINVRTTTVEPSHDHTVLCLIETGLDYDVRGTMRYDVVSVDSEQGGYLLGCLAREREEASVLFLGGRARRDGAYDLTSETRLQGFLRGWGRTLADDALVHVGEYSTAAGAKAAGDYVSRGDKRPGFVFAASDDLAVGFMHGAWAYGLQPGRDYRLVGFDGQHRGRLIESARLTTIDVPIEDMGSTSANLLIERLAKPEQRVRRVVLGGTLYRGDTA